MLNEKFLPFCLFHPTENNFGLTIYFISFEDKKSSLVSALFCHYSASCMYLQVGTVNSWSSLLSRSSYIYILSIYSRNFQDIMEYEKRLRWSRGSVLAFSTQVSGFKHGRSLRIFRGEKKSSAHLSSEGK